VQNEFRSDNRQEGIAMSCAVMANRTSRFWMASRGKTLSGRRVLLRRCGSKSQDPQFSGRAGSGGAVDERNIPHTDLSPAVVGSSR
jgi:hypothetical protein